jgi:uncharacterized membrane protein YeaQ/YmgE (transglycosylase-associated protein family)
LVVLHVLANAAQFMPDRLADLNQTHRVADPPIAECAAGRRHPLTGSPCRDRDNALVAWHCRTATESSNAEETAMTVSGLIIFLVIGAIAGWLAGQIMKGGGFGLLGDIVVGVIGSVIGGWLFSLLGIAVGGLIGSIIAALVGAIILIAVIRLIKRA